MCMSVCMYVSIIMGENTCEILRLMLGYVLDCTLFYFIFFLGCTFTFFSEVGFLHQTQSLPIEMILLWGSLFLCSEAGIKGGSPYLPGICMVLVIWSPVDLFGKHLTMEPCLQPFLHFCNSVLLSCPDWPRISSLSLLSSSDFRGLIAWSLVGTC